MTSSLANKLWPCTISLLSTTSPSANIVDLSWSDNETKREKLFHYLVFKCIPVCCMGLLPVMDITIIIIWCHHLADYQILNLHVFLFFFTSPFPFLLFFASSSFLLFFFVDIINTTTHDLYTLPSTPSPPSLALLPPHHLHLKAGQHKHITNTMHTLS